MRRFLLSLALLGTLWAAPAHAYTLLSVTYTTAVGATAGPVAQMTDYDATNIEIQMVFTYGSGGTTADAYVQTSLDGGTTWIDVAQLHATTSSLTNIYNLSSLTVKTTALTTPTDGSLSANTSLDGVVGDKWRVKYKSTGTYAGGTTLTVNVVTRRLRVSP